MLSKPFPSIHFLLSLLVAASLGACADPHPAQVHDGHHTGQSAAGMSGTSAQGGMMGDSETAGASAMQAMDKGTMCAMYRGMRDAPDDQARQAMMDRRMPGMPPEMRRRHMEMMRQQCQ